MNKEHTAQTISHVLTHPVPWPADSPLVITSYSSMSGLEPLLEAGLSSAFCVAAAGTGMQKGRERKVSEMLNKAQVCQLCKLTENITLYFSEVDGTATFRPPQKTMMKHDHNSTNDFYLKSLYIKQISQSKRFYSNHSMTVKAIQFIKLFACIILKYLNEVPERLNRQTHTQSVFREGPDSVTSTQLTDSTTS